MENENISLPSNHNVKGKIGWQTPSNIAIVKYWGKHGVQLPRNASISLTLSEAHTDTIINYRSKENDDNVSVDFRFEGEENVAFANKIKKYFDSIASEMPFIKQLHFSIESSNSFPHSSGIASSASAMSALAMCLCSIEKELFNTLDNAEELIQKASHLARLGSGSASRSVIPEVGVWGESKAVTGSSDLYAVSVEDIHEVFKSFHDDILIVSAAEKSVSSTAGHALMDNNPYANARYQQANDRLEQLIIIMKEGDVDAFGKIAEDEAMTLHALMMCSDPSYVLMEPNTLEAIQKIRKYRYESGNPVYFTLDAGPNIHLLYPDSITDEVNHFVKDQLEDLCVNGRIIKDKVGNGPKKLKL